MPYLKINGVSYDVEALSDEVKSHLKALAFIDSEIDRMGLHVSALRISRDEIGRRLDLALAHQELKSPIPQALGRPVSEPDRT
jgi:hypothetical protein